MNRSAAATQRARTNQGAFLQRHGMSKTKVHRAWRAMLNRCQNPRGEDFENYMGRGIKVCDRWKIFENFLADVGEPPSPAHSLDRFPNNNGNYEPGNVRWATRKEQNNNKRDNQFITWNGETHSRKEWARIVGISYRALISRLSRNWPMDRMLAREHAETL